MLGNIGHIVILRVRWGIEDWRWVRKLWLGHIGYLDPIGEQGKKEHIGKIWNSGSEVYIG